MSDPSGLRALAGDVPTGLPALGAAGLPALGAADLPADVRRDGASGRSLYTSALGFERELLGQLARALDATAHGPDDDPAEGSAATRSFAELVPGALSDTLIAAGGSGLAEELYRALRASSARRGAASRSPIAT